MGAYESSNIHLRQEPLHRVETQPFPWQEITVREAEQLSWLADANGENGLSGGYTMAYGGTGPNFNLRTFVYFFEDEDTAFKFKLRWA